jgi:hypothetical protein
MKLKCIDKPTKFRNLTRDKEYEAIIDGDNYVITNDAGLRARYANRYFQVIPEVVTLQDMVADLQFDLEDEENIIIRLLDDEMNVSVLQSSNSCGIYNVSGLGNIIQNIHDLELPDNCNYTKLDIFSHVITELVTFIKTQINLAFITFTDNLRNANELPYKDFLNTMALTFAEGRNANSGNDIRLWIFN